MKKFSLHALGLVSLLMVAPLHAEDSNEQHYSGKGSTMLEPVTNASYAKECGACHFAYLPGLLPARSWEKLLSDLSNHFGDNAELDAKTVAELRDYLSSHAAEHSASLRSKRILESLATNNTPLRITEVPFIQRAHHELRPRHVKDNPKVQSLSRCDACHTSAAKGSFMEREVMIPGIGRWD